MYGLVHRQTNGKNRKREWNDKIYFLGAEKKKIHNRKSILANKFYFCNENKKIKI